MAVTVYDNWEDVPEHVRRMYLRDAGSALEAAAPHMRSEREKSFDIPTDADDGLLWWALANRGDSK